MEKPTTNQVAISLHDFAGMQWDFLEHNTKPVKGVKLRMLCSCEGCETLRRLENDDRHIWPMTRASQLVKASGGMSRDEYIKIVAGEIARLHEDHEDD